MVPGRKVALALALLLFTAAAAQVSASREPAPGTRSDDLGSRGPQVSASISGTRGGASVAASAAPGERSSLGRGAALGPAPINVQLDTSRGPVVLEVHPDWAPRGAQRFLTLVRAHYYDRARIFRVIAGRWAQFGVAADPRVSAAWKDRTFPDDPPRHPDLRGTVAFAFAVPNGRTTQVFINLRDNSGTLDKQGFAPFAEVIQGMSAVEKFYSGYGERSGGGIRAGHQQALYTGGNRWLLAHFPRLDFIRSATIHLRN